MLFISSTASYYLPKFSVKSNLILHLSKKDLIELVINEKDARISDLQAVITEKDARISQYQTTISEKDDSFHDLKLKHLRELAKHQGLTEMKPVLELLLRQVYPTTNSASECAQKFVKDYIFEPNSKNLTNACKEYLNQFNAVCGVESPVKESDVAKDIDQIWHRLSSPHPYIDSERTGLLVGGPNPLRSAVSIMFLVLQGHCDPNTSEDLAVDMLDTRYEKKLGTLFHQKFFPAST